MKRIGIGLTISTVLLVGSFSWPAEAQPLGTMVAKKNLVAQRTSDWEPPPCVWRVGLPPRDCSGRNLWIRAKAEIVDGKSMARWTSSLFAPMWKNPKARADITTGLNNSGNYRDCQKGAVLTQIYNDTKNQQMISGVSATLKIAAQVIKKLPYGGVWGTYTIQVAEKILESGSLASYSSKTAFFAAEIMTCDW